MELTPLIKLQVIPLNDSSTTIGQFGQQIEGVIIV